eukprot:269256-Pleurochrysis_carterae.AAC.2
MKACFEERWTVKPLIALMTRRESRSLSACHVYFQLKIVVCFLTAQDFVMCILSSNNERLRRPHSDRTGARHRNRRRCQAMEPGHPTCSEQPSEHSSRLPLPPRSLATADSLTLCSCTVASRPSASTVQTPALVRRAGASHVGPV